MKHDLFKMKQVAQAVALVAACFVAPAANALVTDWGVHDDFEFSQRQVANTGGVRFYDYYEFILPENSGLQSVAVSNNLDGSSLITGGRVALWSGTIAERETSVWLAAHAYDFDGGTGSTSHAFTGLTGGQYFYNVSGFAGGDGANIGLYSLTSNLVQVTPVPEPEIYAMMAAGLGLMGFIGRRRSRRDK